MQRATRTRVSSTLTEPEARKARAFSLSNPSAEKFDPAPWLEAFKYFSLKRDGDTLRALRKSVQEGVYAACEAQGVGSLFGLGCALVKERDSHLLPRHS